ncbi:ParB/RepB/Spo0J family partition protein [Ruminococcaceae bacterium OttesenSCG-928-A16]|nr:ParB/RepB/Spo0J family partition protein [Ruminococcaceae bacterium OttesenSCG-928-A16]
MKNPVSSNIRLDGLDSLFSTEESRQEDKREKIVEISLADLYAFQNHPYKVREDKEMTDLAESIKERGVLMPTLVRPIDGGGYEIVAGHRRKRACEIAGLVTMPAIVREMDDDTAIILMVDSNLQRENLLPSEKAKAYQMKLEALKRQGERRDLTSRQVVGKLEAADIVGQDAGESGRQVQRFIRLTNLESDLLDMVDDKQLAFNPAVELSYLKPEEQKQFADILQLEERTPSLAQAQQIKSLSQQGELTPEKMVEVMVEPKPQQRLQITLKEEKLAKYFPQSYTPRQMEDTIIKLLEGWARKRQQEKDAR